MLGFRATNVSGFSRLGCGGDSYTILGARMRAQSLFTAG